VGLFDTPYGRRKKGVLFPSPEIERPVHLVFLCSGFNPLGADPERNAFVFRKCLQPSSPDGRMIAYVRTGWGRPGGSGGFCRSNLVSEVFVVTNDGKPISEAPLTDTFLAGWTPDGNALVTYRDWRYSLVTIDGKRSLQGELRQQENAFRTERVFYLSSLRQIAWSRVGAAPNTVIETRDHVIAEHAGWLGDVVVPSPDERYLAVFGGNWRTDLWVCDMQLLRWSDLGPLTSTQMTTGTTSELRGILGLRIVHISLMFPARHW
jgi:hypothetical protein